MMHGYLRLLLNRHFSSFLGQYLGTNEELNEAAKILFEKISSGKVKIEIFKEYKLDNIKQAHTDLENRKILGPRIIIAITTIIKISNQQLLSHM